MVEQVQTGGLMKFDYRNVRQGELDSERKDAILHGYAKAYERKRKEKRSKIIFWLFLFLMILIILGYILIKN